jgi:hypothetical protein
VASVTINGRVYSMRPYMARTLAGRAYAEYRLEERRRDGRFVMWHAFGDRESVARAFAAIPRQPTDPRERDEPRRA